jgi:hypothetical protein
MRSRCQPAACCQGPTHAACTTSAPPMQRQRHTMTSTRCSCQPGWQGRLVVQQRLRGTTCSCADMRCGLATGPSRRPACRTGTCPPAMSRSERRRQALQGRSLCCCCFSTAGHVACYHIAACADAPGQPPTTLPTHLPVLNAAALSPAACQVRVLFPADHARQPEVLPTKEALRWGCRLPARGGAARLCVAALCAELSWLRCCRHTRTKHRSEQQQIRP